MSSKLDPLFVNEKEADTELIAEILGPYLRIGKDTGVIIPNNEFNRTTVKNKLLLYCLGRKAAKLKNILQEDENVKLDLIASAINVPLKTTTETASRLKKKGLLESAKSGYFIPNARLINIKAEVQSGHKTHKRSKSKKLSKK